MNPPSAQFMLRDPSCAHKALSHVFCYHLCLANEVESDLLLQFYISKQDQELFVSFFFLLFKLNLGVTFFYLKLFSSYGDL